MKTRFAGVSEKWSMGVTDKYTRKYELGYNRPNKLKKLNKRNRPNKPDELFGIFRDYVYRR